MAAPWVDENYKPLDFTNIVGAPHDIPERAIDKLPIFQGSNVISTRDHWKCFHEHDKKRKGSAS